MQPDVAETVLTAPCARNDGTLLTLAQLYDALPTELHASAARGFLGDDSAEFALALQRDADLSANERTVQLLPQLACVTAVRVTGGVTDDRRLRLLNAIAPAMQLLAFTVQGAGDPDLRAQRPTAWLQCLAPLTNLQSLRVQCCKLLGPDLSQLAPVLTQLRALTLLALEGCTTPAFPTMAASQRLRVRSPH